MSIKNRQTFGSPPTSNDIVVLTLPPLNVYLRVYSDAKKNDLSQLINESNRTGQPPAVYNCCYLNIFKKYFY